MAKKLEITEKIKAAIIKNTGDAEFDFSKVSVFETACYNTLPVNKRGLFKGARATEATLNQMVKYVNDGGFVPMHTLHMQGYEMPVGRVFAAEVHPGDNGLPEVHAQFFINNEHEKLVAGVDTGAIDEVSVGLAPAHLNCSVCGFDYLGPDSGPENVYGHVCNEGHEIGVDGTHLFISGMERWLETSLVSLGAAKNAKILSRTKALMGAESYEKLAASGYSPEATVIYANAPLSPKKPEPKMDIKELVTLNATLSGEKAVLDHKVTTLTASVAELTTAKATLEAQLAEANTKLAAAQSTDLTKVQGELKTATDTVAAQLSFIRAEADRLCVAAGATKLKDDATFDELKASIEENRVKLSASFSGGNSQEPGAGSATEKTASKATAFKAPK